MKDKQDIFYFATSCDEPVQTEAYICGRHKPEMWNPRNGVIDKNIQLENIRRASENDARIA